MIQSVSGYGREFPADGSCVCRCVASLDTDTSPGGRRAAHVRGSSVWRDPGEKPTYLLAWGIRAERQPQQAPSAWRFSAWPRAPRRSGNLRARAWTCTPDVRQEGPRIESLNPDRTGESAGNSPPSPAAVGNTENARLADGPAAAFQATDELVVVRNGNRLEPAQLLEHAPAWRQ
jgi:hypothetical protein